MPPDAARDDVVADGRLFWRDTTYRVPASGVGSVGVRRTSPRNVGVESRVRVLQERTARVEVVGGRRILRLCARGQVQA